MERILWLGLAAMMAAGARGAETSPAPQLQTTGCVTCHTAPAQLPTDKPQLLVSPDTLAADVHLLAGVGCHACHGGDPDSTTPEEAHRTSMGFRGTQVLDEACDTCHHETWVDVRRKSVHARVTLSEDVMSSEDGGEPSPLTCTACHLGSVHGMLPITNPQSPVFLDHQVQTCGACHEPHYATYRESTHGHGLISSGLLVTAVCSDCHRAHGIYRAADRRSTLHATNVAETCGVCHAYVEQHLRDSIHGASTGEPSERTAPGGTGSRKPVCTDCHQGHDLPPPHSEAFRLQLPERCGNCHGELLGRYGLSWHGQLTSLGHGPAAKCSDCHGAHDILAVSDARSRLSPDNRLETCRQCHPYAVRNFCDFDPHADFKDAENYPVLYAVHHACLTTVQFLLILVLMHTVLWFVRSFVHAFLHGRHVVISAGQTSAIVRFERMHRIIYANTMACFLGLTLTGMLLKFGSQSWAKWAANVLGGFEAVDFLHRFFAVVFLAGFVLYLIWWATRIPQHRRDCGSWRRLMFGPDSLFPNLRDARDAIRMLGWFSGLARKPTFERWTYWEKLDYWAVCFGSILIAGSGMILWYPNIFCSVFPGGLLSLAKLMHAGLALLIACSLFLVHLFNTHMRPEKFPVDLSVLTGCVSEEHLRRARPEFLERLRRSGKLEGLRCIAPAPARMRVVGWGALTVFLLGLGLLTLGVLGVLGK